MFLIRAAFWLSIVVILIPTDETTGETPRVTLANALVAAQSTVTDLSGFCDRNPDVCFTGGAALDLFYEKAESGVRMLQEYVDDNGGEPAEGTLNENDLTLPWRGPESDPA